MCWSYCWALCRYSFTLFINVAVTFCCVDTSSWQQDKAFAFVFEAPLQYSTFKSNSCRDSDPWEMVAVDVQQVPTLYQYKKYILVLQDYFTKWVEAISMPDQTAQCITHELIKIFALLQNLAFRSRTEFWKHYIAILKQTLQAFGVFKSHTTVCHPQSDGMVEHFNRSLLQLLRSYVEKEADWEQHFPLVLFAYRIAIHSLTGTWTWLEDKLFNRGAYVV